MFSKFDRFVALFVICCAVAYGQADEEEAEPKQTWQLLVEWALIVLLVCFSGLFSGLNLGLMGLDPIGLQIAMASDDAKDQANAQKIQPLRKHGNWLLCTLLIGNVAVNAALSILLADKTSGTIGFFVSTAVITIFGEIIPQALCSRYALEIGSKVVWIVWPLMWLMFIVAYPIAYCLDKLLGDELGTVYSNKELQKLVEIHAEIEGTGVSGDTAGMLKGALGLKDAPVENCMTAMADVFWLNDQSKLSFDVLTEIFKSGHSRIPIFNTQDKFGRIACVGLLYVKDLILLDPDDEMPVSQIMNAFKHKTPPIVWPSDSLQHLLEIFVRESQHLAFVQDVVKHKNKSNTIVLTSKHRSIYPRQKHTKEKDGEKDGKKDGKKHKKDKDSKDKDHRKESGIGDRNKSETHFGTSYPYSYIHNKSTDEMVLDSDRTSNDSMNEDDAHTNGQLDNTYEYVGIITLEDVIEHVLQTELIDEHDNFVDNKHMFKTNRLNRIDWTMLHLFDHRHRVLTTLPAQELQAVYHFLSQTIRPFTPKNRLVSDAAIKNLLASSSVVRVVVAQEEQFGNSKFGRRIQENQYSGNGQFTQRDPYKDIEDNGLLLYQRDQRTKYFTLLLDGKCEIYAGRQGFRCELTRWSFLCPDSLDHTVECYRYNKPLLDYVPDFTAKVIENSRVLRIKLEDFRACLEGKFDFERQNSQEDPHQQLHSQQQHHTPMQHSQNAPQMSHAQNMVLTGAPAPPIVTHGLPSQTTISDHSSPRPAVVRQHSARLSLHNNLSNMADAQRASSVEEVQEEQTQFAAPGFAASNSSSGLLIGAQFNQASMHTIIEIDDQKGYAAAAAAARTAAMAQSIPPVHQSPALAPVLQTAFHEGDDRKQQQLPPQQPQQHVNDDNEDGSLDRTRKQSASYSGKHVYMKKPKRTKSREAAVAATADTTDDMEQPHTYTTPKNSNVADYMKVGSLSTADQ